MTPLKGKTRYGGICIFCGKPMIVPENQMAGMSHDDCKKHTTSPMTSKDKLTDEILAEFEHRYYGANDPKVLDIKSWLTQALQKAREFERKSLIKRIEGMEKIIPAISDFNNPRKVITQTNTGYNQALSDVIAELREE